MPHIEDLGLCCTATGHSTQNSPCFWPRISFTASDLLTEGADPPIVKTAGNPPLANAAIKPSGNPPLPQKPQERVDQGVTDPQYFFANINSWHDQLTGGTTPHARDLADPHRAGNRRTQGPVSASRWKMSSLRARRRLPSGGYLQSTNIRRCRSRGSLVVAIPDARLFDSSAG